jgi:hypothetical protein
MNTCFIYKRNGFFQATKYLPADAYVVPSYPFHMMDIVDAKPSPILCLIIRYMFKLVIMTITTLHSRGISHSALSSDSILLDEGFIPYVAGLESSACIESEPQFETR